MKPKIKKLRAPRYTFMYPGQIASRVQQASTEKQMKTMKDRDFFSSQHSIIFRYYFKSSMPADPAPH